MGDFAKNGRLNLRPGELVEVKSAAEILATLDEQGRLDALPFMPEMLKYCGQRFRVSKRADKTCDTIQGTWRRRMHDTVHLDLRCDGEVHGGCQARCLLFWKEAWLRRSEDVQRNDAVAPSVAPRCTMAALTAACRTVNENGETVYSCQATELLKASSPLVWWHVGQYVRDIRSGNATIALIIRGTLIGLFNKAQGLLSRYVPARLLIAGGQKYPFIEGTLTKTPKALLDLVPGDRVEIKSKAEIIATLDRNNRNRGLLFDREMVGFCGRQARVLDRVRRIVDEKTGKMLEFDSDCLILEGVYCRGHYNQFCPRAIYSYWREIWLKKVD